MTANLITACLKDQSNEREADNVGGTGGPAFDRS
jgi:hypothetical protein